MKVSPSLNAFGQSVSMGVPSRGPPCTEAEDVVASRTGCIDCRSFVDSSLRRNKHASLALIYQSSVTILDKSSSWLAHPCRLSYAPCTVRPRSFLAQRWWVRRTWTLDPAPLLINSRALVDPCFGFLWSYQSGPWLGKDFVIA